VPDVIRLDDVRGFMFDVDGTLVHRGGDGRAHPAPGAVEVLERIRASGRPLVAFTNGSHVSAAAIALGLRDDGVPLADEEMLTPVESAITHLRRHHGGRPVLLFGSRAIRERMGAAGIVIADGEDAEDAEDAEVVFVAHPDHADFTEFERAARAVNRGAPLYTGSYVRGYAGANGIIFSRGAMVTAAVAKVTGARPRVLGKPSRPAIAEVGARLGVPTEEIVVIGDDLGMDIALGHLGGTKTILVRSGISGDIDLSRVPARRRPDEVIDGVADLLQRLG
jgi:HAD superfamily hydrolase (TIGR01450 family)